MDEKPDGIANEIMHEIPTVELIRSRGLAVKPQQLIRLVRAAIEALPMDVRLGAAEADLTLEEATALKRGGFDPSDRKLGEKDPLARTAAKYAAILNDSLSTGEAARALKVNPSRIRQRLTSKPPTLYGFRVGSRWIIPRFQLQQRGGLIGGFDKILERLDPGVHPVALYNWFTQPNADLAAREDEERKLSPREWLLAGYPVGDVVGDVDEL